MFDILIAMLMLGVLSAGTLLIFVVAWSFFEDTELWEIIKEKMTRKEE